MLLESSRSFTLNADSKNGELENGDCQEIDFHFKLVNCAHTQERVVDMTRRMALARSLAR